jgi:5,10-methylene-tetrahydrofolate dehydrogenase/methenyl tetrahydrofolate cyclohydrolase
MILDGNLVAQNLDNYTLEKINAKKEFYQNKYVAFLLFADNEASRVYIKMKQNKAHKF